MDTLIGISKTLLVLVISSYLLGCGVLYLGQRKLLYYPQPAATMPGLQAVSFEHDDITLRGWIVNPRRDKALLYYGGNAEQIEYNADFFQSQVAGYSVYLVPYRGYGRSEGKPSEAALYADAEFVYDQVKDHHSAVVVMGRSLGTGVATYMAVKRPVAKVVLVSPYDSIENIAKANYWMIPAAWLLQDKYLSWQCAPEISVPTLIVYTESDQVVSAAHTEALIKQFNSDLLTVVRVDNADHATIANKSQFVTAVSEFLQ
jgi:hypothetical protein